MGNQTAAYWPLASSALGRHDKSFLKLLVSPRGAGIQVSQEQSTTDALMEGGRSTDQNLTRRRENRSCTQQHPQTVQVHILSKAAKIK